MQPFSLELDIGINADYLIKTRTKVFHKNINTNYQLGLVFNIISFRTKLFIFIKLWIKKYDVESLKVSAILEIK